MLSWDSECCTNIPNALAVMKTSHTYQQQGLMLSSDRETSKQVLIQEQKLQIFAIMHYKKYVTNSCHYHNNQPMGHEAQLA